MNHIRTAVIFLFMSLITVPFGAAAAQSGDGDVLQAFAACRDIDKKKARLKCFDRAAQVLAPLPAAAAAAPAADAPSADQAQTAYYDEAEVDPQAAFGAEQLIVKRNREEKRKELKDLTALATKITTNRAGKYVIQLENGQVWRQLSADTNKLRIVGDVENRDVIIRKRLLGYALRLTTSKRTILVRRIK